MPKSKTRNKGPKRKSKGQDMGSIQRCQLCKFGVAENRIYIAPVSQFMIVCQSCSDRYARDIGPDWKPIMPAFPWVNVRPVPCFRAASVLWPASRR